MAIYNQVSYGSKGSDVTELQKLLNQNGYSLDTDGIYGDKTLAAVKDYQQKNNLSANGIVDNNMWGALTKNTNSSGSTTEASPETAVPEAPKVPTFSYDAYKPSDTVAQAEALLQQQLAQKPGAYQSTWEGQINDILQQILNREEFSYDLNGDALYQLYADQAKTNGQMAMMDAIGQAQSMTGGYGNSYAQSVGQQAYQAHLQQLNDVVPELYGMALDQHNQEGQDMYNQAALMAQMEDQDYGRYMDEQNRYYTELDYLTGRYDAEREADFSKWYNDLMLQYQIGRDQVADQQWQAQFDEAKRQYDQQYALSASKGSGGGGGGKTYTPPAGWDTAKIKEFQKAQGLVDDGIWGPKTQAAYEASLNQPKVEPFTGTTYSEAVEYLKANGHPYHIPMTQAEWQRHKNNNSSVGGEHEVSTYQEYLEIYVYGVMNS